MLYTYILVINVIVNGVLVPVNYMKGEVSREECRAERTFIKQHVVQTPSYIVLATCMRNDGELDQQ